MRGLLLSFLRRSAIKKGRYRSLWKRFGKPSLDDWTDYLKLNGGFQKIGENCAINPATIFTDPHLISLGSNVRIAGGIFFGHDGSVNMINRAFNKNYDAVGPIIVADNVFIGVGCIVLPGANIGKNTIIGAGSVVSGRVEGNGVYSGNPLRLIRSIDEHLMILERRNANYPWRSLIEAREGAYDPAIEPELRLARVAHFFEQSDPNANST